MTDRLNPEALDRDSIEAAARAVNAAHTYDYLTPWDVLVTSDDKANRFRVERDREYARAAVSAYLAALPAARTIEGVYDLGSPEPEGVDHVIECDEHGNPYERDPEGSNDPTWSKTIDGTRWKGYKDGKEYRDWGDLVRRYGPVIDVRRVPTEGGGE